MRVCVYVRACVSQYDRLRNDVIRMIRQCIYTQRERESRCMCVSLVTVVVVVVVVVEVEREARR